MSFVDLLDAPDAKSNSSTTKAFNPLDADSKATPAPLHPPPRGWLGGY